MYKKFLLLTLITLFVCFMNSSILYTQSIIKLDLYITDGAKNDTLVYGIHPDATNGIDVDLGEVERPPVPVTGVFDVRFVSRTVTSLGTGVKLDLRKNFFTVNQADTFVVRIQSGVGGSPIALTWNAGLTAFAGTLRLVNHPSFNDPDEHPIINVNMLNQTSYIIPGGICDEHFRVMIIRISGAPGININPDTKDFGTVTIGYPVKNVFTISNPGSRDLVISSITSSEPSFILSRPGPITILPARSDTITVTFNPATAGSVIGDINLVHNAGALSSTIVVQGLGADAGNYRSFTPEELVTLTSGKLQKIVKRKADKVEFSIDFIVPEAGGPFNKLHVEWGSPLLTAFNHIVKINDVVTTEYNLSPAIDNAAKKFDYTFPANLTANDKITIHAWAAKGKVQKGKYWWLPAAKPVKLVMGSAPGSAFTLNQPRLPMPSYGNIAAEIFPAYNKDTKLGGLLIGVARLDSPKVYGWLRMYNYKDMLKTLRGKTNVQNGPARWLDYYEGSVPPKRILKENKALPPEKHNNVLMANLIALKFNIVASDYGFTPNGFGDLKIYMPTNPLHDMVLRDIAEMANPLMTVNNPSFDYVNLNTVLTAVNGAFSSPLDTIPGGFSGAKLGIKGDILLASVPFLKKSAGTKSVIVPTTTQGIQIPDRFVLEQNYPNPFNPTTTIEFSLPEDAIVTLKIYNMLGQEVATLINREELSYGFEYVSFDASSLSSGVYIYRLTAEGLETGEKTTIMKKMVLMK